MQLLNFTPVQGLGLQVRFCPVTCCRLCIGLVPSNVSLISIMYADDLAAPSATHKLKDKGHVPSIVLRIFPINNAINWSGNVIYNLKTSNSQIPEPRNCKWRSPQGKARWNMQNNRRLLRGHSLWPCESQSVTHNTITQIQKLVNFKTKREKREKPVGRAPNWRKTPKSRLVPARYAEERPFEASLAHQAEEWRRPCCCCKAKQWPQPTPSKTGLYCFQMYITTPYLFYETSLQSKKFHLPVWSLKNVSLWRQNTLVGGQSSWPSEGWSVIGCSTLIGWIWCHNKHLSRVSASGPFGLQRVAWKISKIFEEIETTCVVTNLITTKLFVIFVISSLLNFWLLPPALVVSQQLVKELEKRPQKKKKKKKEQESTGYKPNIPNGFKYS